jgi:heme-degrading monooxygenase HmoA
MKDKLVFPCVLATCLLPHALPVALAQTDAPLPVPVVVVVKVPKPWYAPRALVVSKMRETVPEYEKLDGLNFKMFSLAQTDGQFGGIYFWRSQAHAAAWFEPAWFEKVERDRGYKPEVRYFEAPVSVDNAPAGTAISADNKTVATLVLVPAPVGVTRQRVLDEFRAAVPVYQKVPGLLRKHFVVSGIGQAGAQFGGVYLWRDQADAERWFDAAWQQRVRSSYGAEARIEWFDIPILTPTARPDNQIEMARP